MPNPEGPVMTLSCHTVPGRAACTRVPTTAVFARSSGSAKRSKTIRPQCSWIASAASTTPAAQQARVAGVAGAKAGRDRWAAITDPFARYAGLKTPLFILALAHGALSPLVSAPLRAADTPSKASPVVASRAKPPV